MDERRDDRPPGPFQPPAIEPPTGGGAIRGIGEKFAANPMTGTGTMTVPLATSRGRSGFEPSLSLQYDSGSGNGPFGFGWSLSTPAITRKTDKGLPRYADDDASDVFLLSGAEDLVPVLDGGGARVDDEASHPGFRIEPYRPRIDGLLARIERWTELATGDRHWRSIARDNVTTVYGRDAASRMTDGARVFSWLICESYDDKGNWIVYEYLPDDATSVSPALASEQGRDHARQRYLKYIRYGNRTSRLADTDPARARWMFEVVLDYGEGHCAELPPDPGLPVDDQHLLVRASSRPTAPWPVRPDPFSTYRAGFEVRTYRRCERVVTFHQFAELGAAPYLVRSQHFDYDDFDYPAGYTVDDERAHPGSTRYGSFLRAVIQSGHVRDDAAEVQTVNGIDQYAYRTASLPPLRFSYSRPAIDPTVRRLDPADAANLPAGIDSGTYRLADLDGEGAAGVLTEQAGTWFYKHNLGAGHFGPAQPVPALPSQHGLHAGTQLLDLAGDGRLDLVTLDGPLPGFAERTAEAGWAPFRALDQRPEIAWNDPNLRFVDLDGDGIADVLVTEDDALVWHRSLAGAGFAAATRLPTAPDDAQGPRLLLADGTQSVYLADMSGDGLTDLVRIRNGEVCYWPNLGYGRFGGRVRLDGVTPFDTAEDFDQGRIRVADLDGSGPADIVYLGRDGPRLYFNQAGNRLTAARPLPPCIPADATDSVSTADLLGSGTACLIWSAPQPDGTGSPLRFVDLLAVGKPNLLVGTDNSLGARTEVSYVSSTVGYLADKRAGRPWVTRLAIPVQVVDQVVVSDEVSHGRLGTRYTYRHGYFDDTEREFRGFALVEQVDVEVIDADHPAAAPAPPVLTKSWFHTGAFLDRARISNHFATADGPDGYYRERAATEPERAARLLPDTVLPDGLGNDEQREACRALKGSLLRQEIYALDGSAAQDRPYSTTEQNFTAVRLQPRWGNRHAVFMIHPRETVTEIHDRSQVPVLAGQVVDPVTPGAVWRDDPRVEHALTLDVDQYGNVLLAAKVYYPRRYPDPGLPDAATRDVQARLDFTATASAVTNAVDDASNHRTPLPAAQRRYEITAAQHPGSGRFTFEQARDAVTTAAEIAFEEPPTPGVLQRRLVAASRTLYRRDDLAGACPQGTLESLALPYQDYQLAFTAGLVNSAYAGRVSDVELGAGGYAHVAGDTGWWVPSNRLFYSPDSGDPAAVEAALAGAHFYLPRRFRTPFHDAPVSTESLIEYDAHDLLIVQTTDALGSIVTVGERDNAGQRTSSGLDYRVLAPALITDINRNRTAVAFDALGMVVGTAAMGKAAPAPQEGDSLDGFEPDLTPAQVADHLADPVDGAAALLGSASSRMVYDIVAFARTGNAPSLVHTLRRETRASDPVPPGGLAVALDFVYCDGFGREIQTKKRAEPGPVPVREPDGSIRLGPDGLPVMTATDASVRWVGSGWKVFDGRARPIRQHEPFFTDTAGFEADAAVGVTSVRCYDPIDRVVATVRADHSWEKTVNGPWRRDSWDVNDTVLISDPTTDPDVGGYLATLPPADYLPTWYGARSAGQLGAAEQRAASRAAVHAGTPTTVHLDVCGRTVLTVVHNRQAFDSPPPGPALDELHVSRVQLDIDGNQLAVFDALQRTVARHRFDLLGRRTVQQSMEAGERWVLDDILGKPLYRWDGTGRRYRTDYDALRRPTSSFVLEDGALDELAVGRVTYGESLANGTDTNARGKAISVRDQAGLVTTDSYDFAGNLLRSARQVAIAFDRALDWGPGEQVDATPYATTTSYDALDRPIRRTLPDATTITYRYNEAALLERLTANLRGDPAATTFVSGVSYDAKGQRLDVDLGNGTRILHGYDPLTFRLRTLTTRRDPGAFPGDDPQPDWPGRLAQNLSYVYDAIGNVTAVRDDAQQAIFFRNRRVDASTDYTYDATYRLIEATAREHLGQAGGSPIPHSYDDAPRVGIAWSANDGNAVGTYQERYAYDQAGNLLSMSHRGTDPAAPGWTRSFTYDEASQLDATQRSNRLTRCTVGAVTETFSTAGDGYDALGNMLRMPQLQALQWNLNGHLHMTRRQAVNETDAAGAAHQGERTWYTYDADGTRVRKVTVDANGDVIDERIYLGDLEIYRRSNGITRESVHIMDGPRRIALVETRTAGAEPGVPQRMIRYQIGNHLGSSVLELDEQSRIVSYEEYSPFGSTVYQAVAAQTQVPKRYRQAGRERDEESGLYHNASRYSAPWLSRWISCDPAGLVDGPNLYRYVRDNPLTYTDPKGTDPDDETKPISLGPLQVSNLRGALTGNLSGSFTLNDIFSSDRSIEINSLTAGGHVHLTSDLSLPSFGLAGAGSYDLNLSGFRISHEFATAELDGRATVSAGPFRLGLDVSAYGSTVLPARIRLSDAAEQLTASLGEFHGWVGINGHLEVKNMAVAGFSASGDIGPGAAGSLQVRGTLGIPSLSGGQATVLGHLSGTATFDGATYNAAGTFRAGLFPIPAYTLGNWSMSSQEGFSASGHYVGPQFGPIGLNVGINPAGNVTDDTPTLRALDAMRPNTTGTGGAVHMFEPGPSFGYTRFHYSATGTTLFNVGVSPTSSTVPYYQGGVSEPFGGPSLGPYFGAQLRITY